MSRKQFTFIKFVVEGAGTFPFDMLRYDACYPADEGESALIDWSGQPGLRRVRLKHRCAKGENSMRYPTDARWSSFGWRVVPDTVGGTDY